MIRIRSIAAFGLVALTACSGNTVKTTLGLDRAAPDEFRVVSRPPLSVPPQFELKPPSATASAPNQLPADKQAQSVVLGSGKPVAETKAGTSAESAFLKRAGADTADPKVRE